METGKNYELALAESQWRQSIDYATGALGHYQCEWKFESPGLKICKRALLTGPRNDQGYSFLLVEDMKSAEPVHDSLFLREKGGSIYAAEYERKGKDRRSACLYDGPARLADLTRANQVLGYVAHGQGELRSKARRHVLRYWFADMFTFMP